jgi:N6-adenosine-specific RNA methylase IME4
MDRQRVGRPKLVARGDYYGVPRLRDLGITNSISHRARRLVDIPTELFETYIADVKTKNQELTTRSLVLLGERTVAREHNRQRVVGGRVDDLIEFAGRVKCGTILLDPPWPIEGNPVLPYVTCSVDEIKQLPIPAMAAPRCHVFLWTLPNWTLWAAKDLLEHWGVRITGIFTWCKSGGPGRGQYFRHATEHLVIGVCARADRFDDHSFNSYRVEPRQDHSRKPDCFFEMIEATSPPPRAELFSRKRRPGWHCWGHEIETPLIDQISTSM